MARFLAFVWLALVAAAGPAAAQDFPQLTGRVVDQADLLSPEQEQALSARSEALEQQTGAQFVVATVNSLDGLEIEDYGVRLGREWQIGRADEDDGIILLVAPNERKVRIETGYGAEGVLPDILAGRIIRNDILPRFRDGDMAGGIVAGADRVFETLQLPPGEASARAEQIAAEERQAGSGAGFLPVLFIVVVFFIIIGSLAKAAGGRKYRGKGRRRRGGLDSGDLAIILWGLSELAEGSSRKGRGGWGGGGWGGGGGGFGGFSGGGGGFGGGGASGGW